MFTDFTHAIMSIILFVFHYLMKLIRGRIICGHVAIPTLDKICLVFHSAKFTMRSLLWLLWVLVEETSCMHDMRYMSILFTWFDFIDTLSQPLICIWGVHISFDEMHFQKACKSEMSITDENRRCKVKYWTFEAYQILHRIYQ